MEEIIKLILAIMLLAFSIYGVRSGFIKNDLIQKIMGVALVIISSLVVISVSLNLIS